MRTTQSSRARALRAGLMLPVLAGSLLAYSAAMAQSTGSQTVEGVTVIGKKQITLGGALTAVETPKAKSIITQEYIATQPSGQNVIQDLNLVPGVSFTNDDPFGMSGGGGHLRVRGLDGSRISLLVDGVPLNDTGNYAIYPGELLDPEIVAQTNINIGSTDVDSPTASAVGGLININSLTPTDTFGGFVDGAYGSYTYRRIAGLVNTGVIGPWGTKAWVEASDQQYDKYKGFGQFKKYQINGKVYQPLWHEGDFIAVTGFYDSQRQPNIYGLNQPTLSKTGAIVPGDAWNLDYLGTYYSAGPTPGVAGNDNSPVIAGAVGGVTVPGSAIGNLGGYYFGNQVNPTDTWNIRAESKFTILPNLHLTVDPAFQSVLADGGTQASTISESDPRLIGAATTFPTCKTGTVTKGVDLNGDGDCMDTVRVFQPSLTHTERVTVNASAIWDINADNLLRISYAYDHGHHRQTGVYGFLNADGTPQSVFGGFGGATPVLAADGSVLRKRDRLSIAVLNQFSGEYVGHFFDQKLRVDLGVRNPHFDRDLNQFCYTSGTNGSGVYCDSGPLPTTGSLAQYNPANGTANPGVAPYQAQVHYSRVLPNVGLSWRFDAANSVYFSYSEEFSAPRTDDLYTVKSAAGGVSLDTVRPETSTTFEGGYRYQTGRLLGSVAIWDSEFHNRIVSTYDPVTGISDDRNVGNVQLYGVDAQIGARPIEHMTALATFSYVHSRLEQDLVFDAAGDVEPLKGKQLVETPQITLGGRVTYQLGDLLLGFQGKYTGQRFTTDVNDQHVPGYTIFDLDARYKLDSFTRSTFLKGSYVQLNVTNLFNKNYFGSIGSQATYDQNKLYYSGTPYAYQGGPRTISVSLKAAF